MYVCECERDGGWSQQEEVPRRLGEPQGDTVVGQKGSTHPVWDLWALSGAGRLCPKQLLIRGSDLGSGAGPGGAAARGVGEVSQHKPAGVVVARAGQASALPSPLASRVPWMWVMLPGSASGAWIQTPVATPSLQSPLGLPTKVCPKPR